MADKKVKVFLTVAIIAILVGIVFITLNSAKQVRETTDAQRSSDVNAILDAVWQYTIDNSGTFPSGISSSSYKVLGINGSACNSTCTAQITDPACLDLSAELVPEYLVAMPYDPTSGNSGNTDYYIGKTGNRITVGSCDLEQETSIEVQR
ncbi:MAG: hypothetical protein COT88_00915 [Candidatus Colwellbacteria bacterium CG10_big_fil_rev_8_21_14_0_10_41_28]|uniref:Type II secretion system protein GspG C-terminal domain-containing protein n=1 Tax=Candidatus Colwellbacteria bacterium CG10_big_fil_rev_8_21_14_0_10_41_28 TaxID=1974539 RepID=A0A2H0VHI6_9BACT|nr:MAG: hypothetical protein COT88_00915 [Candidatus Colwellbacteria bacterium CG10_big_fil_rev_8_21_14_0_10_41_28]